MTLTDFLLSRVAEDEAAARAVKPIEVTVDMGGNKHPDILGHLRYVTESQEGRVTGKTDREADAHFKRWDPARVLAECEAKRRIIRQLEYRMDQGDFGTDIRETLEFLALPYAGHPDYDESWRP